MTQMITSLQNNSVKLVAALSAKKQRDKHGLFVAEGVRLVEEAVAAGWPIEFFVYCERLLLQERGARLLENLEKNGFQGLLVAENVWQKISLTENSQGIIAVMKKRTASLSVLEHAACIAVLDEVQDPGNVGALLRTAAAAACDGVLLTCGSADPFSDKAVRAAMGAVFKIPIVENVKREMLLEFCADHQVRLISTCLEGSLPYDEVSYHGKNAIVFGNEGNGIDSEIITASDAKIRIPLYREVESLNVAAAAAVVLYEVLRQKKDLSSCNHDGDML